MAASGTVVWEWKDDFGHWQAYSPAVSDFIEGGHEAWKSSRARAQSIVDISRCDPSVQLYKVDLSLMIQIRQDTGKMRPVQRQVYPADSAVSQGIKWSFESDVLSVYIPYSPKLNNTLESEFSKGSHSLDLSTHGQPYIIDFQQLTQTRTNTRRVRQIQRETLQQTYTAKATLPVSTSSVSLGGLSFAMARSMFSLPPPPNITNPGPLFSFPPAPNVTNPGPLISLPPPPNLAPIVVTPTTSNSNVTPIVVAPTPSHKYPLRKRASKSGASSNKKMKSGVLLGSRSTGTVFNSDYDSSPEVEDVVRQYSEVITPNTEPEDCCICCEELSHMSGFAGDAVADHYTVVQLSRCKHKFHLICLVQLYNSSAKDGSVQCPTCKMIYGVKTGVCPPGRMDYCSLSESLPGYEDCGSIQITYNIPSGVQGPQQPNPGRPYHAVGFPREAFLPDNEKGRQVLSQLITAFQRRLTFTVSTSVTTGRPDCVVWNEIHHKTTFGSNDSGHGYPDPNYLDNVSSELAAHGVMPESTP